MAIYKNSKQVICRIGRPKPALTAGRWRPARPSPDGYPICAGIKSWGFAGSERGADRAAAMTTLITTVKLNDVDLLA
jgi:hypothetical protein